MAQRGTLDQALEEVKETFLAEDPCVCTDRDESSCREQAPHGRSLCGIVRRWLEHPNVVTVGYGERFWPIFCEQMNECKVSGPLINDAALAAVALEQGAVLCSTDKDFRRFAAVKLSASGGAKVTVRPNS